VLHRQVDEYENEIRFLKDFKSPKSAQRRSSRASPFMSPGFSTGKGAPAGEGIPEASAATIGALEAALLRPALQAVQQDASRYKAQTMVAALSSLPPLNLATPTSAESKQPDPLEELDNLANALSEARLRVRMAKASVTVVDLSKSLSRQSLLESKAKTYTAERKLADAVSATERWLSDKQGVSVSMSESQTGSLLGKVKIAGEASSAAVPLTMNRAALNRLHNCMLR